VDNSQALVKGRLGPNGTFVADKVQAKRASKYELATGHLTMGNRETRARRP